MNVDLERPAISRLIKLLSDEHASLTGQLVLARERLAIYAELETSGGQRQRALKAERAIPEQIRIVVTAKKSLVSVLKKKDWQVDQT